MYSSTAAAGFVGGGVELVDLGLLVGEVARDDERRRDEVHLVLAGLLAGADDEVWRLGELAVLVLDRPARGLAASTQPSFMTRKTSSCMVSCQ